MENKKSPIIGFGFDKAHAYESATISSVEMNKSDQTPILEMNISDFEWKKLYPLSKASSEP